MTPFMLSGKFEASYLQMLLGDLSSQASLNSIRSSGNNLPEY